jgi:hypothetical protein
LICRRLTGLPQLASARRIALMIDSSQGYGFFKTLLSSLQAWAARRHYFAPSMPN